MPVVTKDDAREIARKLRRDAPKTAGRQKFVVTETEGRDHTLVKLSYAGRVIGQYGIRRGSRRDAGHGGLLGQIHLTARQAYDFAKCHLTVDGYIDILVEKHQVPAAPPPL